MDELLRILTFRAGYNTSLVLLGTTLLGVAAGVVGTFAVLRRRALMSDALSHATFPGIGIAFIVATALGWQGRSLPVLLAGAALSGVAGVLAVQAIVRYSRLREDAAIGAVLSVFFGAGVVLMSHIQAMATGSEGGLHHFIYGQTAALSRSDAWLLGALAAGALAAATLLVKEFALVAFDEGFAAVQGWPVTLLDLAMMALVVLVVVIGLQAVGLILVVAMLIVPPAAARFWTERVGVMVAISGVLGGLSGYMGSAASAALPRLPAGAVIVLAAGSLFLVSLLLAPRRGVLAAAARRVRLRFTISQEQLLRTMYEAAERRGSAPVALAELGGSHLRPGPTAWAVVAWLAARGLVVRRGRSLALTEAGLRAATAVARRHRLWEEFLVAYADVAATHVHRAADMVEHVLSEPMLRELEDALRRRGRLPGDGPGPAGTHPLRAHAAPEERV